MRLRAPGALLLVAVPAAAAAALLVMLSTARGKHPAARQPAPVVSVDRSDTVDEVQRAYDAARDPGRKAQLLERAGELGSPQAVRWLADVAEHDRRLASQASVALGSTKDRGSAQDLLAIAVGGGPTLVRANAIRALGAAGGPDPSRALAALVTDDAQPLRIRQEAAIAVGRIGGPDSARLLGPALAELEGQPGESAEQLRIAIVRALAADGSRAARDALARHATARLSTTERLFTVRAMRPR